MVLPQNAEPEQTAFSLLESQSVLTVALNGAGSDSAVVEKTVIPQPVNSLVMARWSLFLYRLSSEATEAAKVSQHDRACCEERIKSLTVHLLVPTLWHCVQEDVDDLIGTEGLIVLQSCSSCEQEEERRA